MKKLVVHHIPHEHSDEAKEKSEVESVICFLLICSYLLVMYIKKTYVLSHFSTKHNLSLLSKISPISNSKKLA